ncbi:1-deoxy-D-xylulose-5-phosphate synthase [Spiroplasma litorale]|uniref:1-deoxy-D-xylulose-5-phosphate synthase n=1 Tax=Spiroplasma litorale TaxID=216942 RepID=A0A0K1W1D2_9MOLU|nr:1-deoxy-D-xylulose-5-phosphate synthase N-terminal domain-containing protein [Spiroplasma litorale]AKX34134.1 1-deoxy-D-xylulose-5-phosphate synthase [Spiroplasma litorale]
MNEDFDYKKLYLNKDFIYLSKIANNIRKYLSDFNDMNFGHIGSNLGIVEITMSFFVFFNFDNNLLLFDTGHQSHIYKLLINGKQKFETIKKNDGLSNFQEFKETEHDWISNGHSSTALSYAIGYGILKLKKNIFVAIGDAAFYTSHTHSSLLNINKSKSRIIILLNDNEESIGTKPPKLKSVKDYCESLDIDYFYCANGNDFKSIFEVFEKLDYNSKKHVLIHFKTIKSIGYTGKNNILFNHTIEKIIDNSYPKMVALEFENLFTNKDFLLNPSMLKPSNFYNLSLKYPNNVIDMGINEEIVVMTANAIANLKKRVFVSIYSSFLQRCFDQLIHDAARNNNTIGFLIDRGGLNYGGGVSHHGIYDVSIASNLKNSIICNPYDYNDIKNMVELMFSHNKGLFFLRYENKNVPITDNKINFKIGQWSYLIYNKFNEITLISYGSILEQFKKYIEINNLNINLINARFIKPLDLSMLNENIYNKIYVYEELYETNSLYEKITLQLKGKKDIFGFNIKSNNVMHGDKDSVIKKIGLDLDAVFKIILKED